MYKIMSGCIRRTLVNFTQSRMFRTRGHRPKLRSKRVRGYIRIFFFHTRVIAIWNALPERVREAHTNNKNNWMSANCQGIGGYAQMPINLICGRVLSHAAAQHGNRLFGLAHPSQPANPTWLFLAHISPNLSYAYICQNVIIILASSLSCDSLFYVVLPTLCVTEVASQVS